MSSESLRVLVVGCGSIGERHLRCFQKLDGVTVGACDVRPEVVKRMSEEYGIEFSTDDWTQALAWQAELGVVCVPAHLHLPLSQELVERGAHLLIEKPLSTGFERVGSLQQTLRHFDRHAGVAYVLRCHPLIQKLKQLLDSREYGQPLEIVMTAGQHFPFYRPAYRDIYYADRRTGGGAIQDSLTHTVNAVEWLVGPMTRVCADAEHLALEGVSVEDTVHVIARHGDVMVSYALNQHQYVNDGSLTVNCERGCLRLELTAQRLLVGTAPGQSWEILEESREIERDDLFVRQAEMAVGMALKGALPACTVNEGARTLSACLAILKSAESGTWVSVEPPPL